ncbi:hypothetical protein F4780DRAFT_781703 [Xylariomycetidae sp. FL0641]|nr:hypothetical protein F4780DRAFT_781703 [Xylariomycetidae sp. FL0641]
MESQQPTLWAVLVVTFLPATVLIIGRIVSRKITHVALWWDDYLAMAAYVIALAWLVVTAIWIPQGLGLHIQEIKGQKIDDILYESKLNLYVAELFYAFALYFGKMSFLCFYWRMFRVTNIKRPIQILMGCTMVWIIFRLFMGVFHCIPVQYFWDATIKDGYCMIDDSKFFFGTLLVHIAIDLAIMSLPVFQLRKLQLPTLQKIGIIVMFLFGVFICVAALFIMILATSFDATNIDFTWNVAPIVMWATIEVNLVTVSTSLPTIKPAFRFVTHCGRPPRSTNDSNSQGYSLSHTKKSIRLGNGRKDDHSDESSSTYQLADSMHGGGGEFDKHAADGLRGVRTFITGRNTKTSQSNAESTIGGHGGIMVKNETVVQVSHGHQESPYYSEGEI